MRCQEFKLLYVLSNKVNIKNITFDRYLKTALQKNLQINSVDKNFKVSLINGYATSFNLYKKPNVMYIIWDKVYQSNCISVRINLKSIKRICIRLRWLYSKINILTYNSFVCNNSLYYVQRFGKIKEITNYLYKLVSESKKLDMRDTIHIFSDNIIGWYDYKYDVLTKLQNLIAYRYNIDNNNIKHLGATNSNSINSQYNRQKNLNYFNTRYLKKNWMQLIDERPYTKWHTYIDTIVVNKLSSLYYYNYSNEMRSILESNTLSDIALYISPFHNININSLLKSNILNVNIEQYKYFNTQVHDIALEKVKLTMEHTKVLQQYDIKLNLVSNLKRYRIFNYIVPTFYNIYMKPTISMLYKNKYNAFNVWYYKCFDLNVTAIKNVLWFYNVCNKKHIYESYNMLMPLTYTLNIDNNLINIYKNNLTRNKIIGYYHSNIWNNYKFFFYMANKTVFSKLQDSAVISKTPLEKTSSVGNDIKSLDVSKHIDINHIDDTIADIDRHIRYRHYNLFSNYLEKKDAFYTSIAYYKELKHLHYEELCAFFTMHKAGISDGYSIYIGSATINKLLLFIIRDKWYIYIKDFLIMSHKMITTCKQQHNLYNLELGVDIAITLYLSNPNNVLNMRQILTLLRELTFLENSNISSIDMEEWYIYISSYLRNKLDNVNKFGRTYRAMHKRIYKVHKFKLYKALKKRLTVQNKQFLRYIYNKLKNSKTIRALTVEKRNNVKRNSNNKKASVSNRYTKHMYNKRRRIILKKISKWHYISNKLGMRLDKTFFWQLNSYFISSKMSTLRNAIIKNNVINKLLSVYSLEKRYKGTRTIDSRLMNKIQYGNMKKYILDKYNTVSKQYKTSKCNIKRVITNKIYNTFFQTRAHYKESDVEFVISSVQQMQNTNNICTNVITKVPSFIRYYSAMIALTERIKALAHSTSSKLDLEYTTKKYDKVGKKINNKYIFSYSNKQPTNADFRDNAIYIYKHQRYLILNYMALFIKQCCFICYTSNQYSIYKNYILIYNLNEPIIYSSNNIYNSIFMEWFYNINIKDFF